MEHLYLKNFGPIKEMDIDLKPLMVFIGESGSGKSAILKLLSLLRWVHKRNNLRSYFVKNNLANEIDFSAIAFTELLAISGLEEFIKDTTEIVFTTEQTTYKSNGKVLDTPLIETHFSLDKVLFLSDNRIILPDILGQYFNLNAKFPYHLEDTFLNFNYAMKSFPKGFTVESTNVVLTQEKTNWGMMTYYISNKKEDDTPFYIKFQNASSGTKTVSFVELITYFYTHSHLFDFNEVLENQYKRLGIGAAGVKQWQDKKTLSIFIEEPELSLFPSAQRRLLNRLVRDCFAENKQENCVTNLAFATHSPYILTSLNNLLLAGEIGKNSEKKDTVHKIVSKEYWLTAKQVGAYAIENGKVKYIIDEDNLINAEYLDSVSEDIVAEFSQLLDIQYGN
jgi:hypothetical protein